MAFRIKALKKLLGIGENKVTAPAAPSDYEKFVAECFRRIGYKVEVPTNPNQEAWDFVIVGADGKRGAVQVKSRRSGAMPHPLFNQLSMYLTGPAGASFDFGVFIVNTQFSNTTLAVLDNASPSTEEKFVYAAVVQFPRYEVDWIKHAPPTLAAKPPVEPPLPPPQKVETPAFRIAVFTEKGGVGKTSVAAHLAGALMHQGRSAVLVDCDAQKNLSLLLGEGVNVQDRRGHVSTLVVERYENFDDANYPRFFIVYDCAPMFTANDPKIFLSVTDTVIPIVLSPLSVLGNGEVIDRTISQIRKVNPDMRFHIVINQYEQARSSINYQKQLLDFIKHWLNKGELSGDSRVKFYEPDTLSIRRSTIMLHWGMFLLKHGGEPRLAFESKVNGAQNLLSDFLALADSVEDNFQDA